MIQELEKAEIYRKKYKFKDAVALYEQILSSDSNNLTSLIGLAECMLNLERFNDAKVLCKKAISINPELASPHTILSYIYSIENDLLKSREEAEIGLKLDKNSAEANCCYGTFLLEENRLEDAKLFLKKSLEIDPGLYLAQYNLSVVYQMTKDFDNQLKQYRILFTLKPNYRNLNNFLGLSVSLNVKRRLFFYITPFLFIFFNNYLLFLPHLIMIWLFLSSGLLSLRSGQKSTAKNRFVMMSLIIFMDIVIIFVTKTN